MNKLEYVVGNLVAIIESEGNIISVDRAEEVEPTSPFFIQLSNTRFESDEELYAKVIVGKEEVVEEKTPEEKTWTPNPSMFGTFDLVPNFNNEDRKMVLHLQNFLKELQAGKVFVKTGDTKFKLETYSYDHDFEMSKFRLILEGFEYKENDV